MQGKYYIKLDFLRAFSVFLVLLSHWIEDCKLDYLTFFNGYGVYGVNLFFTISGFLITKSLINAFTNKTFQNSIKNFFIRRALRLFPALYLFLFVMLFLQVVLKFWVVNDLHHYIYFALYIPNVFIYLNGWLYPSINNLWSLAVEEQFYLIWPFVIYYFKNNLILIFSFSILIGLVYLSFFNNIDTGKLFPIGNLNYLAGGAMLAKFEEKVNVKNSIFYILYLIVLIIFCKYVININFVIVDLLISITFVLLLNIFISDWNVFSFIFKNRGILYIGKISYGIYLYHRFLPYFVYATLKKYNVVISDELIFISLFFLIFIISHISYKYYETYFLNMKAKYSYS